MPATAIPRRSCFLVAVLCLLGRATGAPAFQDHVFVVTGPDSTNGGATVLQTVAPWAATRDVEVVGGDPVVRHFFGLHYVINRASGTVQVIDPATFDTRLTFSVGTGSNPQDILVVDARTAYVSRYEIRWLYRVDPTTGRGSDAIDLGPLADDDGLPEMSMMARDGYRLFIQVQRIERATTYAPVPPSYLAVVDLTRDVLIDVEPDTPGVQGIALTGTRPAFSMVVEADERRLYVSEPGQWLDGAGGIEEIDLDALRASGFITTEAQLGGADIGEFTLVSREKGYVNVHTDLLLTSHVSAFSRADGMNLGQVFFGFGLVRGFAHDRATRQLFLADHDSAPPGVHVLDTVSDGELTTAAIDTGRPPADLVVARDVTPGEAPYLRVEGRDAQTEALTIAYGPACGAKDHDIVFGLLQDVGRYGYSGRACGVGALGLYTGFDPGRGSYFFLVVGTDGQGTEGSYGQDSAGRERPAQANEAICPPARISAGAATENGGVPARRGHRSRRLFRSPPAKKQDGRRRRRHRGVRTDPRRRRSAAPGDRGRPGRAGALESGAVVPGFPARPSSSNWSGSRSSRGRFRPTSGPRNPATHPSRIRARS